jgi:hypothetical protein
MITRLSILALAFILASQADTLHLRDGSTVTGDFLGGTAEDIRFSVDGQIQHFARSNVVEILFGNAAAEVPAGNSEPDWITRGPDYPDAPFLRGSSGYIPLEREVATPARSGGMYGMGATVYRVQGARSPVRVRQGDRIVFVVRLSRGDARQFQLFRLDSRMGSRQTQQSMGGTPAALPVTINRVGDAVYEITSARPLGPGEYAVSPANSNESYCFGVDY